MPSDDSRSDSPDAAASTPPGGTPTDPKEALRAWYAANYQPAEGAKPAAVPKPPLDEPPAAAPLPVRPPDQMQELPSVTPELLNELRQRKQIEGSGRSLRGGAGTQPALSPEAAQAAREERRAEAERIRTRAQKKSRRWQLLLFLGMLAATIAGAFAIYWLIQTKFEGKIPYIN